MWCRKISTLDISVVGSLKEPDSGWVDNINGPTGLMIGAGKGVIRSMFGKPHYKADLIPCDLAVNMTIALAWKVGLEKPEKTLFVNSTLSDQNTITWGEAIETGRQCVIANPFSRKHIFVFLLILSLFLFEVSATDTNFSLTKLS
jgi:fatty acyl-CoA reductase